MSRAKTNKWLVALAVVPVLLAGIGQAAAGDLSAELKTPGKLLVAMYKDFPPYSNDGKGIDVDIAAALAQKLGLSLEIVPVTAGEEMAEDLRNAVWKGHYLNSRTADVMLHVPVDPVLIKDNPQVHIFAPYQREQMAFARDIRQIPNLPGPAGLVAFTKEKVGVERDTLADVYLMSAVGGRLQENVRHYPDVAAATEALKKGEVSAIMAPASELEFNLASRPDSIAIAPYADNAIPRAGWAVGLAVKNDKPELQAALDAAVKALGSDGTIGGIVSKYHVSYRKPE